MAEETSPSGWWNNEPLTACVEKMRQLECEAAYYFPVEMDVCDSHVDEEHAEASESAPNGPKNLVIHVRSGDTFRLRHASGIFGQVSRSMRWLGSRTVDLGPSISRQFVRLSTCFTMFS